ncbi:uncharacterized protein LOC122066188 isoform X2 [Macadamia integrifolia]|uniref:uncharacterized protein LOC122066188 isoform X2 n=1 Tax=Macadamia integrifolia TaxID=60698 RepID=UPI001C4F787F|nr:uncharacterized protein LOC122066188 isoform X2 [Macadamia integrifolia]
MVFYCLFVIVELLLDSLSVFTVLVSPFKIDGGSNLSIKVSWSQKIFYSDGQFSLDIPFSFPEYVTPFVKRISKIEKIQLNVNYDMGTEILCKTTSHPLKVTSNEISGGLLLQSPSVHDFDQREIFCFYLFPGNHQHRKVHSHN